MTDRIELRPFQQRFAEAAQAMVAQKRQLLMADVYCGSGKTRAYLHAANMFYRQGLIQAVAIFTPRLNLCRQIEQDWRSLRPLYADPAMGAIEHRDNDPPLLRRGADGRFAFGYSSTYSSLVSNPELHLEFLKQRRTLLILDEAQQLGVDAQYGEDTTQSAAMVEQMKALVPYIFEVTGTPYRADGQPLLNGVYSDPDPITHMRYLQADVQATYLEGVSLGYLRPFEFTLCDGRGTYKYLDETVEELTISSMYTGLHKVLEHRGYWRPAIDAFVLKVRDVQTIDRRLCGLVAAVSQAQAKLIHEYLAREYPGFRALIAVSNDGAAALTNLEAFKAGKYDALITVRMAYVGYDHKPISVIAMLSAFREYGFLDQLFGRGERMIPNDEIPRDMQALWAIVPDDPKMKAYVTQKREQSLRGLIERSKTQKPPPPPPRMGWTEEAELTEQRAQGIDAAGDLTADELMVIQGMQREVDLVSTPATKLAAAARFFGVNIGEYAKGAHTKPGQSAGGTAKDEERELRNRLDAAAKKCDSFHRRNGRPDCAFGWTANECNKALAPPYKRFSECGMAELKQRERWLAEYEKQIRAKESAHA
jgi:superfamily II DNA or RNA helicase